MLHLFAHPWPDALLLPPRPRPCSSPLPQDMQRPLYMQPKDALEYGIIDGIVTPEKQVGGALQHSRALVAQCGGRGLLPCV